MKRTIAIFISVIIIFALMCGCTATPPNTESNPPAPSSSSNASGAADNDDGTALHEVYTTSYTPLGLDGIMRNVPQASRSNIDKALDDIVHKDDLSEIKIGWSQGLVNTDWMATSFANVQSYCEELGIQFFSYVADGDSSKQGADIETLISLDVDMIVVQPIEPTLIESYVQDAVDAGIPVISVQMAFDPDVPVITALYTNNFLQMFEEGKIFAQTMFGKDKLQCGVITGPLGAAVSESRPTGCIAGYLYEYKNLIGEPYSCVEDAYLDGLRAWETLRDTGSCDLPEYNINFCGLLDGAYTTELGASAMEDMMVAHPEINSCIFVNDMAAVGAVSVLETAGWEPGSVMMVTDDPGWAPNLKNMEEGWIVCTAAAECKSQFYSAIDLAVDIIRGDFTLDANNLTASSDYILPIITPENLDQMWDGVSDYPTSDPIEWEFIECEK